MRLIFGRSIAALERDSRDGIQLPLFGRRKHTIQPALGTILAWPLPRALDLLVAANLARIRRASSLGLRSRTEACRGRGTGGRAGRFAGSSSGCRFRVDIHVWQAYSSSAAPRNDCSSDQSGEAGVMVCFCERETHPWDCCRWDDVGKSRAVGRKA